MSKVNTDIFNNSSTTITNKLTAIYELIEAPVISIRFTPEADSYISSEYPYNSINYGRNKSMQVGLGSNGDQSALIRFDLSSVDSNLNLQKAKLRIYYSYLESNANFNLSTAISEWSELGVTYLNKPEVRRSLNNEYLISEYDSYIEFQATEVVSEWIRGIQNNGFILTSPDNVSVFRARESELSPVLILEYKELSDVETARSSINVDLDVRGLNDNSVLVELTVDSNTVNDFVNVELGVHNRNDTIESVVNVELDVIGLPIYNISSEVNVELFVAIDTLDIILVELDVPIYDGESSINVEMNVEKYINENNYIDVEIDIIGYTDIDSSVNVEIEVPGYNDSSSIEVELIAVGYNDAESSVNVEFFVEKYTDELDSVNVELTIREYSLNSKINVELYTLSYFDESSDIAVEVDVKDRELANNEILVDIELMEYEVEMLVDVEFNVRVLNTNFVDVQMNVVNNRFIPYYSYVYII